jgi:Protein of unknown function (DUF4231)
MAITNPQPELPPTGTFADFRALAQGYVQRLQDHYHWRANWHRRIFRGSGIVVILISAGLPLLAAFDYPRKDIIVAIAGVVIAMVTGLRTFYHWDQMWAVLRRTHFALSHAYHTWQLDFRHAEATADPAEGERLAYQATKTLFDEINKIRGQESDRYFESLSFPPQVA